MIAGSGIFEVALSRLFAFGFSFGHSHPWFRYNGTLSRRPLEKFSSKMLLFEFVIGGRNFGLRKIKSNNKTKS